MKPQHVANNISFKYSNCMCTSNKYTSNCTYTSNKPLFLSCSIFSKVWYPSNALVPLGSRAPKKLRSDPTLKLVLIRREILTRCLSNYGPEELQDAICGNTCPLVQPGVLLIPRTAWKLHAFLSWPPPSTSRASLVRPNRKTSLPSFFHFLTSCT